MSKKFSRVFAALLAFVLIFSLAACGSEPVPTASPAPSDEAAEPTPSPEPTTEAAPEETAEVPAEPTEETEASGEPQPYVYRSEYLNGLFSPFFAETDYDRDATDLTQIRTLTYDRRAEVVYNAIEGETINYNGTDYLYKGATDVSVNYNEEEDRTYYGMKIRDDLVFSDGHPVDIDDAIFFLYACLDPAYDGILSIPSYPIVGLDAYRNQYNNQFGGVLDAMIAAGPDHAWAEGDEWTQEIQESFWAAERTKWDEADQAIIDYCVANYAGGNADMIGSTTDAIMESEGLQIALGIALWGFGTYADGILTTDTTGAAFDLANGVYPTMQDYYDNAYAKYNGDLGAFSSTEHPNQVNLMDLIKSEFSITMAESMGQAMTVTGIEGIRRVNDYELEIVLEGFSAPAVYHLCDIYLAPLHYYGDEAMYKPEEGTYGFPFGDLSMIHAKDSVPLGAGQYKYVNYENNVFYMEANDLFWDGAPEIKHLQWMGAPPNTEITGLVAGTHDASEVSYSPQNRDRIIQENSNGELSGDKIYTSQVLNLGYGYLGLSAFNINVNDEPGSEASKNLRKALATVLAVHRDTAVNSYYEDSAFVINYPISSTSWAAPMATDEGYEVAFSKDIDGNQIYTPEMTEDQRYEAALQAALGYFEAAGYTVEDGKVVAGPAEVRKTRYGDASYTSFECVVGADGTGDHPNFAVFTDFKADMAKIGIDVRVNDIAWNDFQEGSNEGMYDIWTMAWAADLDPDLYQVYHSSNTIGKTNSSESNMYNIEDPELDELIFASRESADKAYRKAVLKEALDIIMDWAVEVPAYQRSNFICFSEERVDTATITPEISTFYKWIKEAHRMQMRQ